MRIAQIILPGASEYERKCQRIDFAALSPKHEVTLISLDEVRAGSADLAHVYGPTTLPAAAFRRFPLPYVASGDVARTRWPFRRPVEPDFVVSPLLEKVEQSRYQPLAEAVEESYFQPRDPEPSRPRDQKIIGTFGSNRSGVTNAVQQSLIRIHRFRDDVAWHVYDHVPEPSDLASLDLWADPTGSENDFDGFVAEALVAGIPVVASRTPVNAQRLEKGRSGFLVPRNDPNELAHAILAALFKPEVAQQKIEAARQTISKFNARQRLRVLVHLYETLIP